MEAVGQLAAGIAHDFNNMLAVIIGYSELLLMDPSLGEQSLGKLTKIKQAGDSAAALTRQLLTFSRQQLVQPAVLNLNRIVTHMDGMLRRLVREDVQFIVALAPDLGWVKADQSQVEQVLMNLVVNAADAMPDGGRLSIETQSVLLDEPAAKRFNATPGRFVKLSVTDTGTGISPEVKAHIFEPFYTTKPIGKGTGLGLATVYGIVQQSGGFLDVESSIGAGSSFHIYLPVSVARETRIPVQNLPAIHTHHETILVVEDAPALRDLLRESLQVHGYQVLTAGSGADAIDICQHHSGDIHVLITDVVMPNMNGRELVGIAKKIRPKAKLIFMSGYTNDVMIRHGIFNKDVIFIQKPFTPAELAAKVTEVIEGQNPNLKSA
jgi:CheY-like chemotaxis protein